MPLLRFERVRERILPFAGARGYLTDEDVFDEISWMRVSLDTDILVSAFATRGLSGDVVRLVLAEHELIVGQVVLEGLR